MATVFDAIPLGSNAGPLLGEQRAIRLACISEVYQKYYHQGLDVRVVVNSAWILERWTVDGRAPDLTKRPFPDSDVVPATATPSPT